jgi:hypothetical protein
VVAYLGVLLPALIALVTILFNQASNRRTTQQAVQEQSRLRIDASMRAAELFDDTEGAPPSQAAAAAGLLALTQLDHPELAVALIVDLWSESRQGVSTETAILVINAALAADRHPDAQLVAAELLCRNAERLDSCQSLHWPSAVDGVWVPTMPLRAKLLVIEALVRMTCEGTANENALRSVAVRLYGAWLGEKDNRYAQGCLGILISALMDRLEALDYTDLMQGHGTVTLGDLRVAAQSGLENPDGFLARMSADRAAMLAEWAGRCDQVATALGSLGTAAFVVSN